jgi:hypothetical protein
VKKLPSGCVRQSLGTEYGRCSRSAADGGEAEAVAEGREAADDLVEDVPVEPRPATGVSGGPGSVAACDRRQQAGVRSRLVGPRGASACRSRRRGRWSLPRPSVRAHDGWSRRSSWPKAPGVRCPCSVFPLSNLNSAVWFAYVHAQAAPRALYRLDLHTHTGGSHVARPIRTPIPSYSPSPIQTFTSKLSM